VLLIRGPLGAGKSTVSLRLAKRLGAERISIDRILDEQGLWRSGRLREFLKANRWAVPRARRFLARGTPVIFDGNFYWKGQTQDLVRQLPYPHVGFTLNVPLAVCIDRDRQRISPHGPTAAKEVYAKSAKFEYGIGIDASRPAADVASDILTQLRVTGVIRRSPRAVRMQVRGSRRPAPRPSPPNA
jgi:predicted kinase